MKLRIVMAFVIVLAFFSTASGMDIEFADSAWDGINVPEGQQCQKFGGNNPSTPGWIVTGIPIGSDTILLEYSDRDSKNMDKGGHGRMNFALDPTADRVEIPSIPGHTFEIPSEFTIVEAHRGPGWDKAGAYMPPCSGGKGHAYYVTIKVLKDGKVTAETLKEMGRY